MSLLSSEYFILRKSENSRTKGCKVSSNTRSVIDTYTASRIIAGMEYRVVGIAQHYGNFVTKKNGDLMLPRVVKEIVVRQLSQEFSACVTSGEW